MNKELIVTIQCLAYNHEPYIRQCLDGFVMQKTNFRFEAIVHDDASTDGTADIIRKYAEKYPDIIKPIFETENQYSKKDGSLGKIIGLHTHGKYVAMCEGDDYWIDPLKLQKQVDFLEEHPEYSYSCHRYNILEDTTGVITLCPNKYFDKHNEEQFFTFDKEYTFTQDWVTKTLTVVYRRSTFLERDYKYYKYRRDVHLVYELLSKGKGVCHSFIGGVFRRNNNSTYNSLDIIRKKKIDYKIYKEFYEVNRNSLLKHIAVRIYYDLLLKHKTIVKIESFSEIVMIIQGSWNIAIKKVKSKLFNL